MNDDDSMTEKELAELLEKGGRSSEPKSQLDVVREMWYETMGPSQKEFLLSDCLARSEPSSSERLVREANLSRSIGAELFGRLTQELILQGEISKLFGLVRKLYDASTGKKRLKCREEDGSGVERETLVAILNNWRKWKGIPTTTQALEVVDTTDRDTVRRVIREAERRAGIRRSDDRFTGVPPSDIRTRHRSEEG